MDRVKLYFESGPPVRLRRHVLEGHDQGKDWSQESVAGLALPSQGLLRPTRGLQIWCLVLLRLSLDGKEARERPLLSGGKGSVASAMDNQICKANGWLMQMLRLHRADAPEARLRRWFFPQNSQRATHKEQPVRIFASQGAGALRPENVEIHLDGLRLDQYGVARLEKMVAISLGEPPWRAECAPPTGLLPGGGDTLVVGRERELQVMRAAALEKGCRILQIVAPGGVGKTALVRHWLAEAAADGRRVFVWSFYRQGFTTDAVQPLWPFRQALAEALGVQFGLQASPAEMVTALLEGFRREHPVLVLDGLEVILHGPGEQEDWLRDDVLPELLRQINAEAAGFCVLTSRQAVGDLEGWAAVRRLNLTVLGREETRRLLRALEVRGLPTDLEEAVKFTRGHPLLVRLLASRFRAEENGGPATLRELLSGLQQTRRWTDCWTQDDPALARMLRLYLQWLNGTPELALLQLCSIFDRLPESDAVQALLADLARLGGDFPIWQNVASERWEAAAERLRSRGLVYPGAGLVLEMHPLVQNFFVEEWKRNDAASLRAAHGVLYEHFKALPEKELPDTLQEMQPLLQAIHHGCQAGNFQRAFEEIAWPKLSRGMEVYIITWLGAFQETRAAMSCFCERGWTFPPDSDLSPRFKGAVLQAAAHCERVLERIDQGIVLMRGCLRWASKGKEPLFAASACFHIIRMAMIRGKTRLAMLHCLRLKMLTMRYPKSFLLQPATALERDVTAYFSSILGCFLLIAGRKNDAVPVLERGLTLARQDNPSALILPGVALAFHAFWLIETGQNAVLLEAIERGQAEASGREFESNNGPALVKGLAWTQQAIDAGQPPGAGRRAKTVRTLDEAVSQARNFGRWLLLADALLARARWLSHFGEEEDFLRDLNQGHELARHYGFALIAADLALLEAEHWCRAGLSSKARPAAEEAARLVKKHGYRLREMRVADLTEQIAPKASVGPLREHKPLT